MSDTHQFVDREERFRSLFDDNLDLILFQDRDSVLWNVNAPFPSLLQHPKAEVVGRDSAVFLPDELVPLFRER